MISHRHLCILELVPVAPSSLSTQQLQQKLIERGFDLSTRMLQRDLQSLYEQGCFGLEKDTRSKPYGWSINAQWRGVNAKVMSSEVAELYRVLYDEAHWLKFAELSFYNLIEQGGVLMAQFMVGELHDKCYQMPVYRIRNVHILQKTRREPSAEQLKTLRSAINKGMKQEMIELIVKVPRHSAVNQGFIELGELTDKQSIDEKNVLLTYQTIDTEQLTDELFKCAHWLEVIQPEQIRRRITTKLKAATTNYL